MSNYLFSNHSYTSHALVFFQISGIVLSCVPVGFNNLGSVYFLVLCVVGAALGVTTLCYNKIGNFGIYPEPKLQAKLITTGPYRYIRHPMYVSLVIMMVGIAGYNYHYLNFLGVVMVTLAVIGKANLEEALLRNHFSEYNSYQQQTKRFIPGLY